MSDTGCELITLAAAGRKINKSTETLARWLRDGNGPQLRVFGRRRYLLEAEFQEWWRERTSPVMGVRPGNGDNNRAPA